jgi:hypothetical protein
MKHGKNTPAGTKARAANCLEALEFIADVIFPFFDFTALYFFSAFIINSLGGGA